MAGSSSQLSRFNPSLQLPELLYPQALHVDVRSERRFILSINWLSAFIHGLWVEDLDGNHLKQEIYSDVSYKLAEKHLYHILKSDEEMAEFIHTHWSDLHNWVPIDWTNNIINPSNWSRVRKCFKIVIEQFLKHGHPNQMTMQEYIYTVKNLYKQIDLTAYFRESSAIQFEGNTRRYSINNPADEHPVYPTDLSDAFFEGTGSQAQFIFRAYKSKVENRPRKRICVFTELRVKFGLENNMIDQGELFECNFFNHMPVLPLRHKCVLLNHKDRKILKEDTVD